MKPSSEARVASRHHAFRHGAWIALLALGLSACSLIGSKPGPSTPATPKPGQVKGAPKAPDKGDPQQRFGAALELMKKNQVQDAEAAFKSLSQDFPQYAGPWTNLGILYARSKRRDLALAALAQAVKLNPSNGVAYNWLGVLYSEGKDYNRARLAYEKALDLNPDHALAHYNLAILLDAHLRRPSEALPHYRAYQKLSGRDELKVMAWVAEIEHAQKVADEAPKAAPAPAPAKAPTPAPGSTP